MNRNLIVALIAGIMVAGIAAFLFWPKPQAPTPEVVHLQTPPPQPVVPPPPQVADVPPAVTPLPALTESDQFVSDALGSLLRLKSLTSFLRTDRFIRNFVATVDNLPTRRAPLKVMPVERAPGKFLVDETTDGLVISGRNAARYTRYVNFADAVDAEDLVALYIRLYPLFQEAYEELGYPGRHFNDRLLVALDDMLNAPDVVEPVGVTQPNVFYLYADTQVEEYSIGQRILMRTGSRNEAKLKSRLRTIKQALQRHMHDKKLEQVR